MSPQALIVDNGSRSAGLIAALVAEAGWQTATVNLAELRAGDPGEHTGAIILTGTNLPVFAPGYDEQVELVRSAAVPVLGICGGMQLIGRAYGVGLERVPPVIGRTLVRLAPSVELFAGLPREVLLFQRHIYRLTEAPPGFAVIASSPGCPVEGIGDADRAVYGMQAHLEFRAEGRAILAGFLRVAERRLSGGRLADGRASSGPAVGGPPDGRVPCAGLVDGELADGRMAG